MRPTRLLLSLSLAVGASAPLPAQVPAWVNDILTAAQLPIIATEARQEGIPNADIHSVLDAMRRARLPASDAAVILDSARAARRENGPVDNFGAFVQTQLDAGKRGQALAAAIRAEHARVGRGRGAGNRGAEARGGRGGPPGSAAATPRGRSGNPAADSAGRGAGGRGRGRPPHTES
jgi:hypothetical protein